MAVTEVRSTPDRRSGLREGDLLWTPSAQRIERSSMHDFMKWVELENGVRTNGDYPTLWRWSVDEPEAFWRACWGYFNILSATPYRQVRSGTSMPGVKWFEGATVNYAEHALRPGLDDEVAVIQCSEMRPDGNVTRGELRRAVAQLTQRLRAMGIAPGDRVVAYMPNTVETLIAFLATVAVGAVWSSASPEFGAQTVIDRFCQIEPVLLFAADGYRFGGKDYDRQPEIGRIVAALPTLRHVVWNRYLDAEVVAPIRNMIDWASLFDVDATFSEQIEYTRVGCDHPLWIVYSSGTTGLPKAIVHSHVGALLEAFTLLQLHFDTGPGRRMFFYTTTGWIMWNILIGALCTGASIVLYDGHPAHPDIGLLWKVAADHRVNVFGASPTYIELMRKSGLQPNWKFDVSTIDTILLSGSPATPETFAWFYDNVKQDLLVASASGGTDIAGGFIGPSPTLPVYAGEIQCNLLGKDIRAFNDAGESVVDEIGEMVCVNPTPSMPLFFWGDVDNQRYRESYFEHFPGVWRHGDFIKINARGGSYVYGRSDSTLNRFGVRIGTAEIYRAVEQIDGIADSLIVCCDLDEGKFFMPLFVVLKPGRELNAEMIANIAHRLRSDCSPRHVPDRVYAVESVPYTLTGKKMEVPVRRLLMGWPLEKVASRDAMRDPLAMDYFVRFATECTDYVVPQRAGQGA